MRLISHGICRKYRSPKNVSFCKRVTIFFSPCRLFSVAVDFTRWILISGIRSVASVNAIFHRCDSIILWFQLLFISRIVWHSIANLRAKVELCVCLLSIGTRSRFHIFIPMQRAHNCYNIKSIEISVGPRQCNSNINIHKHKRREQNERFFFILFNCSFGTLKKTQLFVWFAFLFCCCSCCCCFVRSHCR